MNQIDQPPLHNVLPIDGKIVDFKKEFQWSKWLGQIYQALFRPTVTKSLTFPSTPAQSSSDIAIAFPKGSVALKDLPVLQAPAPPANSCFTVHIAAVDQVVVRLNNYSNAALVPFTGSFAITILNQ